MVRRGQEWIEQAQRFYGQRARALRARRWLPDELEEEFIGECMLIEVVERQALSSSGLPETEPDRIHITTRALTAVRRTVRAMPGSVRSRLESAASLEGDEEQETPTHEESAAWRDVQFVTSLMDVSCAMHWMVWLSRRRSKPKGSGHTVRALAALMGIPRMRAAREISVLEDWFKALWAQVASGEVGRVQIELNRKEEEEGRHFTTDEGLARGSGSRTLLPLELPAVTKWLLRVGILPDEGSASELVEKTVALGLIGEGGRYLVTQDRLVFGITRGGLRDLVEDLGSLATCRQRKVSWSDLTGLQGMVSRHLNWIARVESRDLDAPEQSMILRSIDAIEDLLAQHPLGLQYWGAAFAKNRGEVPEHLAR